MIVLKPVQSTQRGDDMKRLIIALRLWKDAGLAYSWRRSWRSAKYCDATTIQLPWRGIAARLLTLVAIALAFSFGVDVGKFITFENLVKTCISQPGERLIATHQFQDGTILCEYGNAYGMKLNRRKAMKP
jgi:hypothetical protein